MAGGLGFRISVTVAVPPVVTSSNVRLVFRIGVTETSFPAGTVLSAEFTAKMTEIEQFAVIGSVVNMLPDKVPVQVPPIASM